MALTKCNMQLACSASHVGSGSINWSQCAYDVQRGATRQGGDRAACRHLKSPWIRQAAFQRRISPFGSWISWISCILFLFFCALWHNSFCLNDSTPSDYKKRKCLYEYFSRRYGRRAAIILRDCKRSLDDSLKEFQQPWTVMYSLSPHMMKLYEAHFSWGVERHWGSLEESTLLACFWEAVGWHC